MDDLLKIVISGLIGVGVGGVFSWRAGLNQRIEDSIRTAYADFGAAWELYIHSIHQQLKTWWRWEHATSYDPQEKDEALKDARDKREEKHAAVRAAGQRVLLLDKDSKRRTFVKALLDQGAERFVRLPRRHEPGSMEEYEKSLKATKEAFDGFRDSLPHHFTGLGQWVASD